MSQLHILHRAQKLLDGSKLNKTVAVLSLFNHESFKEIALRGGGINVSKHGNPLIEVG